MALLAVFALSALVAGCGGGTPPPPPDTDDFVLLIANYSDNRIEVMGAESNPADLVARPNLSFDDTGAVSTVHAVWGPDDRIYVSDFALNEIRVFVADDALGSAVDDEGNLYVGNRGRDKVARFDGAASLAGDYPGDARQADAMLAVGLTNTAMVALAPDGALWVASSGPTDLAQLVRVTGQAEGVGDVALTPPNKQFSWSSNTNAYHDAGGMLFHSR